MSGARQPSRFRLPNLSSIIANIRKVLPYIFLDSSHDKCRCRGCGKALSKEQKGLQFCSHYCVDQVWDHYRNTNSGKLCRMPGCNKPCYSEKGKIHDFCGKTHATEYKEMAEEFQRQFVRDSRLKAVTRNSSGGGAAGQTSESQQRFHSGQRGERGSGPIRFYNRDDPYYEFTNFYPASITLDGKIWPTSEHYFQAQKFVGTPFTEVICNLQRPREAFDLSRNPAISRWRRKDWDEVKIDVMRKALLAKFTQHKDLRELLLGTGQRYLIEHSPYDNFWGNGGDDTGQNHLGLLLMEIRSLLHELGRRQTSFSENVVRESFQSMETSSYGSGSTNSSELARRPLRSAQPTGDGGSTEVPVTNDLVDLRDSHYNQLRTPVQETHQHTSATSGGFPTTGQSQATNHNIGTFV